MTAREFFEKYESEQQKMINDFKSQYAKILLSLPIRMTYETWSYLHSIVELEKED